MVRQRHASTVTTFSGGRAIVAPKSCGGQGVTQCQSDAIERLGSEISVQVGEDLAGGFEFGLQGGDPGDLLGARLLDYLVDRD